MRAFAPFQPSVFVEFDDRSQARLAVDAEEREKDCDNIQDTAPCLRNEGEIQP